jgi:tetratricopeptide (TPR) repeat protein
MNLRLALASTVVLATVVIAAPAFWPGSEEDVGLRFAELAAAGDREGTLELFRAHPGETLPAIDRYLEGPLSMIEEAAAAGGEVDAAEIADLHAVAVFGASCADEAFGTGIFSDYAAGFAGQTPAQQRDFRAGQAAFAEAMKALKDGRHADALERGRACVALAQPLGDWWGTAMGLTAVGKAERALGNVAGAAAALGLAAQLDHDLRLRGAEYANLRDLAAVLSDSGSARRALEAAGRALALARELGDSKGEAELEALRAQLGAK